MWAKNVKKFLESVLFLIDFQMYFEGICKDLERRQYKNRQSASFLLEICDANH